MSNDRLTLAAVLAFIHAVLSRFFVSFTAEITQPSTGPLLIAALLAMVNFAIFLFLFITFKRLLNERYDFIQADRPILALIGLGALGVIFILLPVTGLGYSLFSLVSRGFGVVSGLLWIWLALLLLKLPAGRIKWLKPYAFVVAAAGIGYASIVLTTLAVILSMIADILLGVIFIQETGKPEPGKIEV